MTRDVAATQSFYGRWATLYDVLATAPGVRSWRARAAASLDLSPGDTVLEVGCGTGANFPYLRERVGADGRVVGVDLARGMLAAADRRIARNGWSNVHVLAADAVRPPVAGPVDAVLATFLVGMLKDPGAAVADWVDLLAPGGRLALLNAERSPAPLALPLNLAFRAFVRLTAPGLRTDAGSPARRLEAKNAAARDALEEATTLRTAERFAGGVVWLAAGEQRD